MSAAALLHALRALIADPATYTPDGVARDAAGKGVPVNSGEACAWSLYGALAWCSGRMPGVEAAASALHRVIGGPVGIFFGGHAEALRVVDAAIAALTATEETTP